MIRVGPTVGLEMLMNLLFSSFLSVLGIASYVAYLVHIEVVYFFLVGALWGITNPFLNKGM